MLLTLLALLGGCQGEKPDQALLTTLYTGEYSAARVRMQERIAAKPDRSDRNHMLDRMRLTLAALADGYPRIADRSVEEMFELLTTQGVNQDKTVSSVLLNEDLKIWKGEPFEQALAFHYIAIYHAMQGSWDNARAAILNSTFHLKSFGADAAGKSLDTQELVDRSVLHETAGKGGGDQYLNKGYKAVESNFALGYLMTGIADQMIARQSGDQALAAESREQYAKALAVNPALAGLIRELEKGDFNAIVVIDFGIGPRKIGTGRDNAIAKFIPITPAANENLIVRLSGGKTLSFPVVCDVNLMAQDHQWNNLEDVRVAKSIIGDALLIGAGATVLATNGRSKGANYAALGMLLAGLASKAGAHADTRYCEMIPQRIYIVPVKLTPGQPTDLSIDSIAGARIVLPGLTPDPDPRKVKLSYVRPVLYGNSAAWQSTGAILYSNDITGIAPGLNAPYILGGNCLRKPTLQTLRSYQASGYVTDLNLQDLEELYRLEGIITDDNNDWVRLGKHVLEGGNHIVPPAAGSSGFLRLFAQYHAPYQPKSQRVRDLADRLRKQAVPVKNPKP